VLLEHMVSSSASKRLSCGSSFAAATAATTFLRWGAFWKIPYERPCEVVELKHADGSGVEPYFRARLRHGVLSPCGLGSPTLSACTSWRAITSTRRGSGLPCRVCGQG
jgi:hypothetical protein